MVYRFEDFLNENNNNGDYIDFKKTNMLSDYRMLNTKLFGNELEEIPLSFFKSKKVLGLCHLDNIYKTSPYGRKKLISSKATKIRISNFYKLTRQQYLDVLAHEMIHQYIAQNGIKDNNSHGRRFHAMMDDINRKFPEFNIKQSELADDYAVSTPNTKVKELGVLIFNEDGKHSIMVINEKMVEDRVLIENFAETLKKNAYRLFPRAKEVTMTTYKVSIPSITSYTVKRTLNSLELASINDTLLKQIEASSKIMEVRLK